MTKHQGIYPAIFLDRDGVIIHNRKNYVRSWEQVKIYPQAIRALARMKDSPYKLVIVTNQSGVAKGLIPLSTAEAINTRLISIIEQNGGRIDGVFMCTHNPADQCSCRKPQPGLLLAAAQQLNLDLTQSIMIGDALSDVEAGQRAGVKQAILVLTGRGKAQQNLSAREKLQPFQSSSTLERALKTLQKLEKSTKKKHHLKK